MENFKRATINEEALKNFREQSRIAAAKDRVVHAALSKAAKQIVDVYGPNISLDASKDSLTETRQGIFSGKIEAQLSVETGTGIKRVAYPIEVRASTAILGTDEEVKAALETKLARTDSDEDKKFKEYAKHFNEKVAELHQADEDTNKVIAYMENGMSLEEATSAVFNAAASVKKQAELNNMSQGSEDNMSNIGINAEPQAYITIDANNLPGSFDKGDVLDVSGIAYECLGREGSFLKFKVKMD